MVVKARIPSFAAVDGPTCAVNTARRDCRYSGV